MWDGVLGTLREAQSYTESTVAQLLLETLRLFTIFQCRFGDFPSDVSLCYLWRVLCCFLSDLGADFSIGTRILCMYCEPPTVEIDGKQQEPHGCKVSQQLPCMMEEAVNQQSAASVLCWIKYTRVAAYACKLLLGINYGLPDHSLTALLHTAVIALSVLHAFCGFKGNVWYCLPTQEKSCFEGHFSEWLVTTIRANTWLVLPSNSSLVLQETSTKESTITGLDLGIADLKLMAFVKWYEHNGFH